MRQETNRVMAYTGHEWGQMTEGGSATKGNQLGEGTTKPMDVS